VAEEAAGAQARDLHPGVLASTAAERRPAQLVVGAGGKSRYGLDGDPRVTFGDDDHDGALRMQLWRGRADLALVAQDGTVLDRSVTKCSPRP